jgi:hypothetical protein
MTRRCVRVLAPTILVCAGLAGCSQRVTTTNAPIPAAEPKQHAQKPPSPPRVAAVPVAGGSHEVPRADAPAAAAPAAAAPTNKSADGPAPPATESAYVFSPQQAVSATAQPPNVPPSAAPAPPRTDETAAERPGELHLVVLASAPELAAGGITTVDVMASSTAAVVDAPLHLTYDPTVVEFVDGSPGSFLTQGGSSVVFLADGLSRPGDVAVAAGRVDRQQGASGSGLLCRVRFRALRAGSTPVVVGRAKAWGSRGEALTVVSTGTAVVVR